MILSTIMNIHSFVFKKDYLFRIFIQYFIRHFFYTYTKILKISEKNE